MTVGKDRTTGFLREHLKVRDSHDYVRIGCVWKICDAFYGMLHSDELYQSWGPRSIFFEIGLPPKNKNQLNVFLG